MRPEGPRCTAFGQHGDWLGLQRNGGHSRALSRWWLKAPVAGMWRVLKLGQVSQDAPTVTRRKTVPCAADQRLYGEGWILDVF